MVPKGRIVTHWPDMLRVAGSLITNQVRAYDLLRMLTRDGCATQLGQALGEYGRIPKTLHLLAMVDPADETYRRAAGTAPCGGCWTYRSESAAAALNLTPVGAYQPVPVSGDNGL